MTGDLWATVDQLIQEQRFEAAREQTEKIRLGARERSDDSQLTRALIKETQLRMGLHGYETAVRFLHDEAWPESERHRLILGLFYGQSLRRYLSRYRWEIAQREKVAADDELDLKLWTVDQIDAEVQRTYAEIWTQREAWGGDSIGDFAEHIHQNDYPARIRGTLRDAVTYLWVELLADRSFWSPKDSNEIYRLNLSRLLAPDRPTDESIWTDPDIHPLSKISRLLKDLEAWHQERSEPEAAFEARLSLLRQVSGSFDHEDERRTIQNNAEQALDVLGRGLPWWSMGKSFLADSARRDNRPDALVIAHRHALEGAEAHPESVGGQMCRRTVASLEQPSYQLESMAVDGPDRRSIRIAHNNLKRLHLRAYEYSPTDRLAGSQRFRWIPEHRQVQELVAQRKPVAEWTVDLPQTSDYRSHHTYTEPPLSRPGGYVIVASARSDFALSRNHLVGVFFQLSDILLKVGNVPDGSAGPAPDGNGLLDPWWIYARSGRTGEPLAGAEVIVYRLESGRNIQTVTTMTTSDDGFVSFNPADYAPKLDAAGNRGRSAWWRRNRQHVFAARLGDDQVLFPQPIYLNPRAEPEPSRSSLIYTDRSAYRPGQDILWKVVAFESSADRREFKVQAGASLTVRLRDANGEQVAEERVTTNEMGSASGRFAIPPGRLLGRWSLAASGSSISVQVEEYKRPTFKVELDEPPEPIRLNREAVLTGQATYYFGLPLSDAQVRWRVRREPVYSPYYFWLPRPDFDSRVVAQGQARVDPEGRFELKFTPEADERLSEEERRSIFYRYAVVAEVTEAGGETREGNKSFQVGFVAVDAVLETDKTFFSDDKPLKVSVRRTHPDGRPLAGRGTWTLSPLRQPEVTPMPADLEAPNVSRGEKTPGDLLIPRWQTDYEPERVSAAWQTDEPVASGELEHGAEGSASIEASVPPGFYRLTYSTLDAYGTALERSRDLLVVGEGGPPLRLPALFLAESESTGVGEMARFLVSAGFPGQHLDLRIARHGQDVVRRSWVSDGRPKILEIPVEETDRGGLTVSMDLVRDHQALELSQSVTVPWDNQELQLRLTTFRDELRPGSRETWRVELRTGSGHLIGPRTAELLAYMYDKSLELFGEHAPPSLRDRLPGVRPADYFMNNLGQARSVWWHRDSDWVRLPSVRHYTGDRLVEYDGYGIGGPGGRGRMMAMRSKSGIAEMAMSSPPSPPAPLAARAVPESAAFDLAQDADGEAAFYAAEAEAPAGAGAETAPEVREDFAETAFWFPHLLLDEDGGVAFELTVPDSVTEWDVWIHGLTKSMRFASLRDQVRTVKDLLVRPYLPRFFREGDRAELRVVVSNAGETELRGGLSFEIFDPETEEDLLASFGLSPSQTRDVPFVVEPGKTTTLRFPVTAPRNPGAAAVRVYGTADDHSDGELRPIPVLPSRLYLAQSRFAALQGPGKATLNFEDLAQADQDSTLDHESLIVTLDAQLFYGVLGSLPYLIDYPYECTEQTLNRFVSTGILSSLFDDYPAVSKMAADLAKKRDTLQDPWEADDPNRRMLLEETPWLRTSRGGAEVDPEKLLKVLDPKIAAEQRKSSLAELQKQQLSSGAFPWWSGGPPSAYVTLYVLEGLSRALEYEVEVPKQTVVKAWAWLADWWRTHRRSKLKDDVFCCPEASTYLAWILSRYPDVSWTGGAFSEDDINAMVDHGWTHRKAHSPRLKGYLALVLLQRERETDARRVWESVMDSAKTDDRLGTYWSPEDRAWLWYNDTVESHAFALRVLTELSPEDPRRAGLVQWLMLDKKLGHWKSTRATAEVIYAMVKYLEAEGALGVREDATVKVGRLERHFEWKPDAYTGAGNRVVIEGADVESRMSEIVVEKSTPGTLFASATWHFATETLPDKADGDLFRVERAYFRRSLQGEEWVLEPLAAGDSVEVGDQLEIQLSIRALHAAEFVHLRDPRAAGFEPEDAVSGYRWETGIGHYREIRDSGTNFFFDWLPAGQYTLRYRVRAATAGQFRAGPATLQSMYAPEHVAYSAGRKLRVDGEAHPPQQD